ncbi:MAG: hypothetical protein WCP97_01835 [bacterium]
MLTKDQQAVLYPLVFFDYFSVPLTSQELYGRLFRSSLPKSELALFLENDVLLRKLFVRSGDYWGMRVYSQIEMSERQMITKKKLDRAYLIVRALGWIPFIRSVCVSQSVAFGAAHENSDIDLFIITAKNRMSITRIIVLFWLAILGLKISKKQFTDQACLGFWVEEQDFDFSLLQLEKGNDVYFLYWMATLIPMLDDGAYAEFAKANSWVGDDLPNWTLEQSLKCKRTFLQCTVRCVVSVFFLGCIGDWVNVCLFGLQKRRLFSIINRQKSEFPTRVMHEKEPSLVVRPSMFKLHPSDRRWEIRDFVERTINTLT